MKIPKLNVRLLRRIQRHILAEPRRLDMASWAYHCVGTKKELAALEMPSCGTRACIAGWAVALGSPAKKTRQRAMLGDDSVDYYKVAKRLLGLTDDEADFLFLDFCEKGGTKGDARFMCRCIDSLIKDCEAFVPRD